MKDRKGDWRDLLASHSLAIDIKKLWLGFLASIVAVVILAIMAFAQSAGPSHGATGAMAQVWRGENLLYSLVRGRGLAAFGAVASLFDPFHGGIRHLVLSALLYFVLLAVLTYCGGAITRLTALQYARDDIPTLGEGLRMVRAKRKAYLFAPLTPLFGVLLFGVGNIIVGLVGSIPVVGPWIMVFLIPLCSVPATIIIAFIAVLGALSFGLMLPAVSIGGKDAFEGWSSAYSYLLWGFNRFICYTALAAGIGVLTTLAAYGLTELFIYLLIKTVSIGLIGRSVVHYVASSGYAADLLPVTGGSLGLLAASWVTLVIAFFARCLVIGYAVSYFFTANTIICFLLRKHVDRIDVDQVYVEEAEEKAPAEEEEPEAEQPEPGEEQAPQAAEPSSEQPEGSEEPSEQ